MTKFLSFRIVSRMSLAAYLGYRKVAWQPFRRIVDESYSTNVGTFYWMRTFFMHIAMELCSSVRMEYLEGCFHESSLTRPIIQKSALLSYLFFIQILITNHFRVLIATIKDMGSCPCPRCLMPKASFNLLGLFRDMRDRLMNLRTYCLPKVIKAREFIYTWGNTVDGSRVQATLGEGSWVPTVVRIVSE
jgi:hypothetical protein